MIPSLRRERFRVIAMAHGRSSAHERTESREKAFTLLDLLAVLAVVTLLAVALLPARAASQSRSQGIRCLDNLRQVMGAVLMYTHDNHDLMPPNPGDGGSLPGYYWCDDLAWGGMPGDPPSSGTFNPDVLTDTSRFLLAPYIGTNVSVYRCTADPRRGVYSGTNASLAGTIVPAVRTISMSGAVGTIDAAYNGSHSGHSGIPNLPVTGEWLSGSFTGNRHNLPWRTYGKTADMVVPAPASLLVITEEDPFSINDGFFAASVGSPQWVDWPATLHNMGCVVTFGDGHAELHKWLSPGTRLTGPAYTAGVAANDPDWSWMAQHVSARF